MSSDPPVLRARRIVLRDLCLADLTAVERWMQPGRAWRELDGPYFAPPTAAEITAQVARLRTSIESGERPEPRTSLVIADARDDALIGRVSRYWQSEETHWLSLGIDVYDPRHWGRGIGFEALGTWCQYVLDALPELVRLDLRTWSGNVRMMRLATRLGFVQEACFRSARIVRGERYDGLGYGMLRGEWVQRYPGGFTASLPDPAERAP